MRANQWARLFMAGFPALQLEKRQADLKKGEPEYALWEALDMESLFAWMDDRLEYADVLHRVLKSALGRERYADARRAQRQGGGDAQTQYFLMPMAFFKLGLSF